MIFIAKEGEEIDFTCELDEYAQLVKDFKESGLIKDRRKGLIHNYKNSFLGREAVDWLVSSKKVGKYHSASYDLSTFLCLNCIGNRYLFMHIVLPISRNTQFF